MSAHPKVTDDVDHVDSAPPPSARPRGLTVIDERAQRREVQHFAASRAQLDAGHPELALPMLLSMSSPPFSPLRVAAASVAVALLLAEGRAKDALALADAIADAIAAGASVDGQASHGATNAPRGAPVDGAVINMMRAQALRQLGHVDDAIVAAVAAVAAAAGNDVEQRLVLAECQRAAGALSAAIETLEAAVPSAPDDVRVLGHLAAYVALRGGAPEHDHWQRFCAARNDDDPEWWRHAAFSAACAGFVDDVVFACDEAFRRDPGGTRAFVADAPEVLAVLGVRSLG